MLISEEIINIKEGNKQIKVKAINNNGLKVIAMRCDGLKAKDFKKGNNPFSFISKEGLK